MGRGGRKEGNAADAHWTDQHPDRRHWTPHQRALAGMMTQEAYEGLYGRGPIREVPETKASQQYKESGFIGTADSSVIAAIAEGEWQDFQIANFLEEAEVNGEVAMRFFAEDDPFMEALWQRELQRTRGALEEMGAGVSAAFLRDREEDIRSAWGGVVAARFGDAMDEGNLEELPFSLQRMLMDGTFANLFGNSVRISPEQSEVMQEEMISCLARWSKKDPAAFDEYAENTLLPALAEDRDVFGRVPLRNSSAEIEEALRATLKSLYGQDYANDMNAFVDTLESTGIFRGASNRADCYRDLLGQLAAHYFIRQRTAPRRSHAWGEVDESRQNLIETILVRRMTGALHRDANLLNDFMISELEGEVQKELYCSGHHELGQIAGGFDDPIYEMLRQGDITALEAWVRARENAVSRGLY